MSARQKSLQRNLNQIQNRQISEVQKLNVINEELFPLPTVENLDIGFEFNDPEYRDCN